MKSLRLLTLLTTVFLVAATAAAPTSPTASPSPADAKGQVREFEERMMKQLMSAKLDDPSIEKNPLRDSKEFQDQIRAFFAGLSDSRTKIEAIGMIDSRYVYLMRQDLAVGLLGPLVRDQDPAVRAAAAEGIAYRRCAALYEKELLSMLENDPLDAEKSRGLFRAMGQSKDAAFVPALTKLLAHENVGVRLAALQALVYLSPQEASEHIGPFLDDPQAAVRFKATEYFFGLGTNGVTLALRMLEDRDDLVRREAIHELGVLLSVDAADESCNRGIYSVAQTVGPQKIAEAAEAIARRLTDEEMRVRAEAAKSLGNLHTTKHAAAVAALLGDKELYARERATEALGKMGDPAQIEKLRPILSDDEEQIRTSALNAIRLLSAVKSGVSSLAKSPPDEMDIKCRYIALGISTRMNELKNRFPILERTLNISMNGDATITYAEHVDGALEDPTKPESKLNVRRAVIEKDGFHIRLFFYRGPWQGTAKFVPVDFGDLHLWYFYEHPPGDVPPIITAISKIIQEEKAKFDAANPTATDKDKPDANDGR